MRYFFYGTLMDPEVRAAVLGRAAACLLIRPAMLSGYRRVHAPGRSWPVLIRAAGGRVQGVAVEDVDARLARALLRYEGPAYRLAMCRARLASGAAVTAAVFLPVVAPAGGRPWHHGAWLRRDKAVFLARLLGARAAGNRPTAAGHGR